MQLRFDYFLDKMLCTYTGYGVSINVYFDEQFEIRHIDVSGDEYDSDDDILYYLYIREKTSKNFMRISYVVQSAKDIVEDLHKEALQDQEDEDKMAEYLSSPQTTGRI